MISAGDSSPVQPLPLVVVIEDELDICELLAYSLNRAGYRVETSNSGDGGAELVTRLQPDLVLLDLMLPGAAGHTVCKKLKTSATTASIPIIMLTASGEEEEIILGLECGADDYITKPFSLRELLARIAAVLRRYAATNPLPHRAPAELCYLGIRIITDSLSATVDDQQVLFTAMELRILTTLLARPGQVFSRTNLIEQLGAEHSFISERNIDVHIRAIRKKIGSYSTQIESVRGVGYRLQEIK